MDTQPKTERRRAARYGPALASLLLAGAVAVPFAAARSSAPSADVRLCAANDFIPLGLDIETVSPAGLRVAWLAGRALAHSVSLDADPVGTRDGFSNAATVSGRATSVGTVGPLAALRAGDCDAALLGYEPQPDEMDGLRDAVIARDAVVLLIDENSWQGGDVRIGRPVARGDGLRELTSADLKGMLGQHSAEDGHGWAWQGKYERWDTWVNSSGQAVSLARGGHLLGWRAISPTVTSRLSFEPGRFDTQTALHQALGLDERRLSEDWVEFSHDHWDREEEVIAREYLETSLFGAGLGDFQFRVTFASRRVAELALRNVPVRVIAIDGFDPIADPTAIAEGRYPLTRDVRLVTRTDAGPAAPELAAWFLSAEGQSYLTRWGYVPMMENGAVTLGSGR